MQTFSGVSELTCEACGDMIHRLRAVFLAHGIDLDQTALWRDLADMRRLAEFSGPVFAPHGPLQRDPQRTRTGFRDATFLSRTVKALEKAATLPGFKSKARPLKNWQLFSVKGAAREAGDHLYEVEMAGRLSFTSSGLSFAGADLRIEDPEWGLRFSIACKRPKSRQSLARAVQRAVGQVRREKTLGLVMVCLDRIVDRVAVDVSGRSLGPLCCGRVDTIVEDVAERVRGELDRHAPHRERARGRDPYVLSGVLGVVFTGTFLLHGRMGESGPEFANTGLVTHRLSASNEEWSRQALRVFERLVLDGERSLIALP